MKVLIEGFEGFGEGFEDFEGFEGFEGFELIPGIGHFEISKNVILLKTLLFSIYFLLHVTKFGLRDSVEGF